MNKNNIIAIQNAVKACIGEVKNELLEPGSSGLAIDNCKEALKSLTLADFWLEQTKNEIPTEQDVVEL